MDNGEFERVVNEIKAVYGVMAETTGTLWENTAPTTSCNHGIAAYAGYALVRALTDFIGFENDCPKFAESFACKHGEFYIPCGNSVLSVIIKDGKREISLTKQR